VDFFHGESLSEKMTNNNSCCLKSIKRKAKLSEK
jgi:hypothetical protein